jgi:D-serine deaminase-like pyridoxal phosphate-dependent protein
VYIATPVLKRTGALRIPALDEKSRLFAWWDVNQRETFFIYGGNWQADLASPAGLQLSGLYGRSSNQELVNGSPAVSLAVDDQVFLRPTQSEAVLLQFGDLLAVRGGKIVERWPVYQES